MAREFSFSFHSRMQPSYSDVDEVRARGGKERRKNQGRAVGAGERGGEEKRREGGSDRRR
eukprot:44049-Hanusia_phi.AAC.2